MPPKDLEDDSFSDARLDWMKVRLQASLKIKDDKWRKLMGEEYAIQIALAFLETDDFPRIFFYSNARDDLCLTHLAPRSFKKKAVYFMRAPGVDRVDKTNMSNAIFYGDITPQIMSHLKTTFDFVYLPLLKAPMTTKSWPPVLVTDLLRHSDRFSQKTCTMEGRTQGRCCLPMGVEIDSVYAFLCAAEADVQQSSLSRAAPLGLGASTASIPIRVQDSVAIFSRLTKEQKDQLHALESTILDWVRQIRGVLSSSPDDLLASENKQHLPNAEIEFWVQKAENLRAILEQLQSPRAQTALQILQMTESSYYTALTQIEKDVISQLAEVQCNANFLLPLKPYFGMLADQMEPTETVGILQGIFRGAELVWFYAPFYMDQARFVFLFRSLCNAIIQQIRTLIDYENILKGDPNDGLASLEAAMRLSEDFLSLYQKAYGKVMDRVDALEARGHARNGPADEEKRQEVLAIIIKQQLGELEEVKRHRLEEARTAEEGHEEDAPAVDVTKGGVEESKKSSSAPENDEAAPAEEAPSRPRTADGVYEFNKGYWPGIQQVFRRLEAFLERIKDIHRLLTVITSLHRLERLEVGGDQGAQLSSQINQIYTIFLGKITVFQDSTYDPTDLRPDNQFETDFKRFMTHYQSWEKRLLAIMDAGFETANSLEGKLNLIDSFSGILPDQIIRAVVDRRLPLILEETSIEIQSVYTIFEQNQASPDIPEGMPPLSGRVMWSRTLLNRIRVPFTRFEALNDALMQSRVDSREDERFALVAEKYRQFQNKLVEYQDAIHRSWCMSTANVSDEKLREYLLSRSVADALPPGTNPLDIPSSLCVNFDPTLDSLLKESRYFKILGLDIPESCDRVYSRVDQFRFYRTSLDLIVSMYNHCQRVLYTVERPMFYKHLSAIEDAIRAGYTRLTWNDDEQAVRSFITTATEATKELYGRVVRLKENQDRVEQLLRDWAAISLLEKPLKGTLKLPECLDQIERRISDLIGQKSGKISEHIQNSKYVVFGLITFESQLEETIYDEEEKPLDGEEGAEGGGEPPAEGEDEQAVAQEQEKTPEQEAEEIQFDPDKADPDLLGYWDNYLIWLAEFIQTGILQIVLANIERLQVWMDDSETAEHNDNSTHSDKVNENSQPLVEVSMVLHPPELLFEPLLSEPRPPSSKTSEDQVSAPVASRIESLSGIITSWLTAFVSVSSCIPNPAETIHDEELKRTNPFRDFLSNVNNDKRFVESKNKLLARVARRCKVASEQASVFSKYKDIYTQDYSLYLQRYLEYGPNVSFTGDVDVDAAPQTQKVVRTIVKKQRQQTDQGDEEDEDGNQRKQKQQDTGAGTFETVEIELPYYRVPNLDDFNDTINRYKALSDDVGGFIPASARFGWMLINLKPAKQALTTNIAKWINRFTKYLVDTNVAKLHDLQDFITNADAVLAIKVGEGQRNELVRAMEVLSGIKERAISTNLMWEPMNATVQMLAQHSVTMPSDALRLIDELPDKWKGILTKADAAKEELEPHKRQETDNTLRNLQEFMDKLIAFREEFRERGPFLYETTPTNAYPLLDFYKQRVDEYYIEGQKIQKSQILFNVNLSAGNKPDDFTMLISTDKELVLLKSVWDVVDIITTQIEAWKQTDFKDINTDYMEETIKKFSKEIRNIDRGARSFDVYVKLDEEVKNFLKTLPLISSLRSPSMGPAHWKALENIIHQKIDITTFKLEDLINLELHRFADDVESIVARADKEKQMKDQLLKLEGNWKDLGFQYMKYGDPTQEKLTPEQIKELTSSGQEVLFLVCVPDELVETLEDNQLVVQNMMNNKYVKGLLQEVTKWQEDLAAVDAVITLWLSVQQTWGYLEPIFIGSEDIRAQLPEDSKRFEDIHYNWKKIMEKMVHVARAITVSTTPNFQHQLESLQAELSKCEKALADYLDAKRRQFPRFYFVSSTDLLDILSKGQQPKLVQKHLSKIFDNIHKLKWHSEEDVMDKLAHGMYSGENEYVPFTDDCQCDGSVETWLNNVIVHMRETLRDTLGKALTNFLDMDRELWLEKYPAQVCLVSLQIWWSSEVNTAFEKLEEGNEMAMKDYAKRQNDSLMHLIGMIQGDLDKNLRTKISTICTIEVHSRDIVASLIKDKVDSNLSFAWQSQLKLRFDDTVHHDCFINICDAEFRYSHEYLGCTARLVITPLTDRCYITLTQSLHLIMGGAPAGPAGTGKTETTKDLGRGMGVMVYVFNCSSEMDFYSMGNIFKGLAQSGAWGCFDEFNRISIEVLSVVAMQVKSVLDAIRGKKERFDFEGIEIGLVPTCGFFITMNPGYAGRTELPDNLKALFRPISMVVPDFAMITEIMLVSNGFMDARTLAKKFTTLYSLNKELLSKQDHYDWGLRAIIAVCRTAGGLRRTMIPPVQRKRRLPEQ
ncbi:Dynein heavy chain [Giardia muris]|uniref:Dynein heavy chain n=1 Tax=Giardia muris TaxID=5742 RepID=A0A4Z1T8Z2_GIAMU|nr:Dynein heavy chain [Giardia muris]|eukprot:TNJ29607.1 Dynein heavy chain [Giardia muris]